jgi:hypothetical protein
MSGWVNEWMSELIGCSLMFSFTDLLIYLFGGDLGLQITGWVVRIGGKMVRQGPEDRIQKSGDRMWQAGRLKGIWLR